MLNVGILFFTLFGCKDTEREPYRLPPVSDFIIALNEQNVERIDHLVSADVVFQFEDERYEYTTVREAFLSLRDTCEVIVNIYDFYGDYIGERYQFPGEVHILLPIRISSKDFFIDSVVFMIDSEGKISSVLSDSIAFKYLVSSESRADILRMISEE